MSQLGHSANALPVWLRTKGRLGPGKLRLSQCEFWIDAKSSNRISSRAGGPCLKILQRRGAPGLDFQTWDSANLNPPLPGCVDAPATGSAGGPDPMEELIHLRVPPVPRLWGPGRLSASTRGVASLSRALSIPTRSPPFRTLPSDRGGNSTIFNPPAFRPVRAARGCGG